MSGSVCVCLNFHCEHIFKPQNDLLQLVNIFLKIEYIAFVLQIFLLSFGIWNKSLLLIRKTALSMSDF